MSEHRSHASLAAVVGCGRPCIGLPRAVPLGLSWAISDMWTAPEDDPRSYSNPWGEKATYREYLGNYRLTIEMKCGDWMQASSPGARYRPAA
jgi:hypothetical protein